MDDSTIAHLAPIGAVEAHGPVARHAARTRDHDSISEAGILIHTQLEREDRGDCSFYRIWGILDPGPFSKSVAETGPTSPGRHAANSWCANDCAQSPKPSANPCRCE